MRRLATRAEIQLWWGLPVMLVAGWTLHVYASQVQGLSEAPPVLEVLVPMLRFARDVAAVCCVGCATVAAYVLPSGRLRRLAAGWALGWFLILLVQLVVTVSEVLGTRVAEALNPMVLRSFLTQTTLGNVYLWQLVAVPVVALLALLAVGRVSRAAFVLVAASAAVAPALVGHGGLQGNHTVASVVLAAHLGAVAVWVGGLYAMVVVALQVRTGPGYERAVRGFSSLALVCVIVVGETGLFSASLRLASPQQFVATSYGTLVLAKAVLLLWLVTLGWKQRQRLRIPKDSGGLAALAAVELAAMGAAIGLSVVLARLGPPPVPGTGPMLPMTTVLLALAAPLVLVRGGGVLRGAWVERARALPEATAVLLLVVVAEASVVSGQWAAALGGLALFGLGWLVLSIGSRSALIVLAAGWPIVALVGHWYTDAAQPELRARVLSVVVAEALIGLALMALVQRSEVSRERVEAI